MNLTVAILSFVFILLQVPLAIGSPVISTDENIGDDEFYSVSYTNPESAAMHEMASMSGNGNHSQVQLDDEFIPKTIVSPDGNCSVFLKVFTVSSDMGSEDYAINSTAKPRDIRLRDISTMGCYAVAFSPDSKMYAAPRLVPLGDGRNGQYAIDIMSVDTNELIHRELTPFYLESTRNTTMDWDRAEMYGVYWSEDGSSIVYELLGGNVEGVLYPATLVTNRLNVNYTELRKMNGYEDPVEENSQFSGYDELVESYRQTTEEEQMNASQNVEAEDDTSAEEPVASMPGFGILIAAAALIVAKKWMKGLP